MEIMPKIPSFGEKFSQSLFGGLSKGYQQGSEFAQKMALQKQKSDLASQLKGKEDDTEKFSYALDTLGKMREKLKGGKVGTTFGFQLNPFSNVGSTGKDREEFAAYGRSLIPLVAAGVPVRNQREFDEYSKIITDPNASTGQIEGALNGLEDLFSRKAGIENNSEKESNESSEFSIIKTPSGKKVRVPKNRVKEALSKGGSLIE